MFPGLGLDPSKVLLCSLRNVKYLKSLKALYQADLLKDEDNYGFVYQLIWVVGYLDPGHYKFSILVR